MQSDPRASLSKLYTPSFLQHPHLNFSRLRRKDHGKALVTHYIWFRLKLESLLDCLLLYLKLDFLTGDASLNFWSKHLRHLPALPHLVLGFWIQQLWTMPSNRRLPHLQSPKTEHLYQGLFSKFVRQPSTLLYLTLVLFSNNYFVPNLSIFRTKSLSCVCCTAVSSIIFLFATSRILSSTESLITKR